MKKIYQNYVSKLLLTLVMSLMMLIANAQNKNVSGRVTDSSGGGVPSAGVTVKGTKVATVADANGNFTISAKNGDVLVFTSIGYSTQEVIVGNQQSITVSLKEDDQALDEIVVTGYGTQKRSTITGSVSKLDRTVLETGIRSNPASALAGTIPGLRVQQTSGRPGAQPLIILRGGTNYNGTGSPLVLVDGLVRAGFSDINQDDIESIEVLKDAASSAIYGARAANGVILITTKKGKAGAASISVKGKVGVNNLSLPYTYLGAEDYIYWSRKAIETSGKFDATRLSQLNTTGPFGTGNLYKDANGVPYDGNVTANAVWSPMFRTAANEELLSQGWKVMIDPLKTLANGAYDNVNGTNKEIIYKEFSYEDYALRDLATTQDYNISVNGGNDKGKYYAGLGSYSEKGLPINTFYKRLTFVLNGDYKIKPWLTSISGLNFANAQWRDVANIPGVPVAQAEGNYLTRALGAPPTMRGFNQNGDLLIGRDYQDGNPAVNDDKFIRNNNTDKFTLSQAFKVDFLKSLNLRVSGNYYYSNSNLESFNKDFLSSPGNYNRVRSSSASFGRALSQTYNATLNYNTTIATKHNISAQAGSEYYDIYSQGLSASGSGAPTDDFRDLEYTNSTTNSRAEDTGHSRQRILSFFGNVNYDYDNKYLLTAIVRRDGYSRLINNRFGTFPGVSVGWNVHNEEFFKSLNLKGIVNTFKLKAGYGEVGNVNPDFIGDYTLQGSYGTTAKYNGNIGYGVGSIANPNLKWESLATKEIGFETRLINRIDLSAVYYIRKTTDKVASLVFPITAGIGAINTNNGSMQNQGVEVDLNYAVFRNKDWNVNFNLNGAYNANKVLKLPSNGLPNNRQGGFQVYDPNTKQLIFVGGTQEGQDPNVAYAYQAMGIIRTQADLDNYASSTFVDLLGARKLVHPNVYAAMNATDKGLNFPLALGDVMWKDVNGDGIINTNDRVKMGRTVPRWTGGFGANATWKGLTLSTRFDYALGFVAYDGALAWFLSNAQGTFNTTTDVHDTWTPSNPNAKYPTYYWADQLFKNNTFRESSMFYKKGDYLALREVNLTYKIPSKWASKLRSEGINLSVSGQNLVYWSQSTLFSPESGSIGIGGAGGYPLPKILTFGAQFIF